MTRRSKSCKDTFVPFPEKIAHFDAGIINFSNSNFAVSDVATAI